MSIKSTNSIKKQGNQFIWEFVSKGILDLGHFQFSELKHIEIIWKQLTDIWTISHGPQPCITQWNYEPWRVGPPKMDGSW